jgi:hypothetical protein
LRRLTWMAGYALLTALRTMSRALLMAHSRKPFALLAET